MDFKDLASKCHRPPHAAFGQSKSSQEGKHSRPSARHRFSTSPLGVTALCQPMDVSVMRTFKKNIDESIRKAKLLPLGPRDVSDVFATYLHPLPEAAVVDDASVIEDESFDE
ncbi:hypothetical protein L915_08618 [Phytophthora nicotianae]|uniref:Uncharacterized protein n=1 Tax=Phytophthora nicotianae TaxID=4792 RepID=W2GWX6_PHYNI|nr:hypothetical protein L915_08618 [Phytophthora nicotianae]ETL40243.1 hypothetical protein L916_08549 [Phytophthora nicotianae]ETM46652.1 hypothetical protein L914_08501 [Phytophthora nicotianae]